MPVEKDVLTIGHQLEKLVSDGKSVSCKTFRYTKVGQYVCNKLLYCWNWFNIVSPKSSIFSKFL